MGQITNLTATTELEAVNTMLGAIGETLLPANTDLATVTAPDVVLALDILRQTTREVQSVGWRFNREFGYEITPTATLQWVDTSGVTTTLNIFKPPANLAKWRLTQQASQYNLDLTVSPSRKYQENGKRALVFYDRNLNRDGLDATKYPKLYIDPTWLWDFEELPVSARLLITIRSARIFAQRSLGSETLSKFTAGDEQAAEIYLMREEGDDEEYSIFDNATVSRITGGRPLGWRGSIVRQGSPGPA